MFMLFLAILCRASQQMVNFCRQSGVTSNCMTIPNILQTVEHFDDCTNKYAFNILQDYPFLSVIVSCLHVPVYAFYLYFYYFSSRPIVLHLCSYFSRRITNVIMMMMMMTLKSTHECVPSWRWGCGGGGGATARWTGQRFNLVAFRSQVTSATVIWAASITQHVTRASRRPICLHLSSLCVYTYKRYRRTSLFFTFLDFSRFVHFLQFSVNLLV